jgi:ATP adenylyltransferase
MKSSKKRDSMNRLFSPWRMKYIQSAKNAEETCCIFCDALTKPDNNENLIVFRGKTAFVLLNLFPYTSGHMMVAPFVHKASLDDLEPIERSEMMELISQCLVVLKNIYSPQAFNVGANIGEAAGAGVPGHVHMHVVARWSGDTNFMSTVGEVRVLPETIEETFRRIFTTWHDTYPDQ